MHQGGAGGQGAGVKTVLKYIACIEYPKMNRHLYAVHVIFQTLYNDRVFMEVQ